MRTLTCAYAVAAIATATAAGARCLLDPLLGVHYPFFTFFFSTLFTAWKKDWKPALAALILGGAIADYFFIPPPGSFHFGSIEHLTGLILYILAGGAAILTLESRRAARLKAESHAQQWRMEASAHQRTQKELEAVNEILTQRVFKQTEATQQSQERMRLAGKHGRVAPWELDVATGRTEIDESAFEWLGLDPQRPPRTSADWQSLCHPDDYSPTQELIVESIAGWNSETAFEWRLRRADGTYRWVMTRGQAIRDENGSPVRVFGTIIDINDRKEAEKTILDMAAIVESSEDAIYSWDMAGNIATWNPGAEKIFGLSPEEAIGRPDALLTPRDREDETAGIFDRVMAGGRVHQLETIRLRKDGSPVHVSMTISPIRDAKETIVGVALVARDITRRKHLEQQMGQAQKMEAVGHLAGGIAHDFNNLLTVINGSCELLLAKSGRDDDDVDLLGQIADAGDHAASLTRQLLIFSRQQTLKLVVLNLNAVIRDVEKMLRRLIGEDVDLACILDPNLRMIKADAAQLKQVIINLAVNARDAMPRGGHVTITTRNTYIDASFPANSGKLQSGWYAMLTFTDAGRGMDDETKARIFEPFFTTKEVGRGTGLGLATVHGIIKQSGGAINVYSEVGMGATFKIYLPITEDQAEKEKLDEVEKPSTRGVETVLLVEDEDGVRKLSQVLLESQGYTVLTASNGKDALEKIQSHEGPLDLVVTDVVMPYMDGCQLVEAMSKSHPNIKVLYFSGYTGDALIRHGVVDDGNVILEKPFTACALAQKVREVLDSGSRKT